MSGIEEILTEMGQETPQETTEEAVKETPEETPNSVAIRRMLQKEAHIRAEKEALKSEREQWLEQKSEWEKKISDYERAKQYAKEDPNQLLSTFDLSEEQKLEIAQLLFFEAQPDLADEDTRSKLYDLKMRRLEMKIDKKLKESENVDDNNGNDAYNAYVQSVDTVVSEVSQDTFPTTAEFMSSGQFSSENLSAQILKMATDHAQKMNGKGNPLTPQECMERIEKELSAYKQKNETKEENVPRSIRNSATSAQKHSKINTSLSEEGWAERRARALALLKM